MLKNIGTLELVIIGVVILLLFGGKKLPELTRGVVDSIKTFRKAYKEGGSSEKEEDSE